MRRPLALRRPRPCTSAGSTWTPDLGSFGPTACSSSGGSAHWTSAAASSTSVYTWRSMLWRNVWHRRVRLTKTSENMDCKPIERYITINCHTYVIWLDTNSCLRLFLGIKPNFVNWVTGTHSKVKTDDLKHKAQTIPVSWAKIAKTFAKRHF